MSSEDEIKVIDKRLEELYEKINLKRKRFISVYLSYYSIAKASKAAGYKSRQSGQRMMTNDDTVKEIIKLERLKLFHSDEDDLLRIVSQMRGITERCLDKGDYKAAMRSLELEAKAKGLFQEKSKSIKDKLLPNSSSKLPVFVVKNMTRDERDDLKDFLIEGNALSEKYGEDWIKYLPSSKLKKLSGISLKSRLKASKEDIQSYFNSMNLSEEF